MPVIYVDVLLAVNLFIDYLLLCAVARVLHRPTRRRRLIPAALLGAVSSLFILLPSPPWWLTMLWQGGIAAAMVAIAFANGTVGQFLKAAFVLYILSALFAGVTTLCCQWLSPHGLYVQNGVIYWDLSPLLLIALTVVSYLALCLYERVTRKRIAKGCAYRVTIRDGGDTLTLRAMADSGHSLTEHFTAAPVILADKGSIAPLLSRYDPTRLHAGNAARIRYIPFSTIGGEGVLSAFRPEQVTLWTGRQATDVTGAWVAGVTTLGRGEYEALIGPALTEQAYRKGV